MTKAEAIAVNQISHESPTKTEAVKRVAERFRVHPETAEAMIQQALLKAARKRED